MNGRHGERLGYFERTDDGHAQLTSKGKELLENLVTSTDDDTFGIKPELGALVTAAAMARLSRRGDDLRITLVDEFIGGDEGSESESDLLNRVVNEYGDDSVKQLIFGAGVFEDVSNIATKKIEWGRLAGYLEQSTRYIYYDQKNAEGKYRYHQPEVLAGPIQEQYSNSMDRIFEQYSEMVRGIYEHLQSTLVKPEDVLPAAWRNSLRAQACDAARGVLPAATQSTVGVVGSGHAIENLIIHLMSDENPEMVTRGKKFLNEMRQVLGVFLEKTDDPSRGGAVIDYKIRTKEAVAELTNNLIPEAWERKPEEAKLVDYYPQNEFDVVANILHEHSHQPLDQIQRLVNEMDEDTKQEVLDTYIGNRLNRRHKPGRALEKIHYSWDIVCDYGIFRDLQRHRIVDEMSWQGLTPWYGYEVPELVAKAGFENQYHECFDTSELLYTQLFNAGYETEAQYATLFGHRMRWKLTYNAREAFHLHELRTGPAGHPGYRRLVNKMHEEVAKVHPNIANAMIFVNKDEDPELTRLAAEQATQRKRIALGLEELAYDEI